MAKFIKRLGDESVAVKFDVTIDSLLHKEPSDSADRDSTDSEEGHLYAIQVSRGPMKNETPAFEIHESREIPIGLTFSR